MLTQSFIIQIIYGFIAVVLGLIIIFILRKIFRRKALARFFNLRNVTLIISFLSLIPLLTNPYQNYFLIIVGGVITRYLSKPKQRGKRGYKQKEKRRLLQRIIIIVLYLALVTRIAKGRELIENIGEERTIQTIKVESQNTIIYTQSGSNKSKLKVTDSNQDTTFDTVEYDRNNDGYTDIKRANTEESSINKRQFADHQKQKNAVIAIVIALIFLGAGLGKTLNLKPQGIMTVMLLATFTQHAVPYTKSYAQELIELQNDTTLYKNCAQDPFEKRKCDGVPLQSQRFFQLMQDNEFSTQVEELEDQFKACQEKICDESTIKRQQEEWKALREERKVQTAQVSEGIQEAIPKEGTDSMVNESSLDQNIQSVQTLVKTLLDETNQQNIQKDINSNIQLSEQQKNQLISILRSKIQAIDDTVTQLIFTSQKSELLGTTKDEIKTELQRLPNMIDKRVDAHFFQQTLQGQENTVETAVMTTYIGKIIVGTNPIDMIANTIGRGLRWGGKTQRANTIQDYQIQDAWREIVVKSYEANRKQTWELTKKTFTEIKNTRTEDDQLTNKEKATKTGRAIKSIAYGYTVLGSSLVLKLTDGRTFKINTRSRKKLENEKEEDEILE